MAPVPLREPGTAPARKKRVAAKAKPRVRKPEVGLVNGLSLPELGELEALRAQLEGSSQEGAPLRWNADPEDVHRSVVRLVLTLIEFVRKLLERQAIRRMEAGTLTDAETEDIGRALMALEATISDLTQKFGLTPEDLNMDLGPLGRMI
jgi:hypothetical protein